MVIATGDDSVATKAGDLGEQILFLASPKRLALKGLGEKTIDQLIGAAPLKTAGDLFHLEVAQVANLPQSVRLGETAAAAAIVKQIAEAKARVESRARCPGHSWDRINCRPKIR